MSGASVTKLRDKASTPERVIVTPEMAMKLLEHNTSNRPVNQQHVQRLARQMREGRWRYNGDTIKLFDNGDIADGQHRLWACIESGKPFETLIVGDLDPAVFALLDTMRLSRSASDVISLAGISRHRNIIGAALQWLIRWERDTLETYRTPAARIENIDVEAALAAHPGIVRAAERVAHLRMLSKPSLLAFLFYIIASRNAALADQMIATLNDPSGVNVSDPFFRLRSYFTADHHKRKDPLVTIALAIKAANAAHGRRSIQNLHWRNQGKGAEAFPTLEIDRP